MRCRLFSNVAAFVASISVLLNWAVALPAQTRDERLQKVIQEWNKRRDSIRNVRYLIRGERIIPKGIVAENENNKPLAVPLPRQDISSPIQRTFILDVVNNRFRLEIEEKGFSWKQEKLYPIHRTDLYDGQEYKILHPGDPNPDVHHKGVIPDVAITTGDASNRTFDFMHWPLFDGLGIVQSIAHRSSAKKLVLDFNQEDYVVHGEGLFQGRKCLVLRTNTRGPGGGLYDEYWVDTQRESVVLKHLFVSQKVPLVELSIDYRKTSRGTFPSGWTYTRRAGANKVREIERVRVSEFEFDLPFSQRSFDLTQEPGMKVARTQFAPPASDAKSSDPKISKQTLFEMNHDGQLQEIDKESGALVSGYKVWYWIGGVGIGVLVVLLWIRSGVASQLKRKENTQ
jgi:hypothetical protein